MDIEGKSIIANNKEFVTRNLASDDLNLSSAPECPPPNPPLQNNDVAPYPPVLLPTCSRWFDLNSINPIERAQLPTIFASIPASDKAQEQQYMATRNFIVEAYRRNPREYLSVTECRKFIEGDAALLLRLHSFVDYWGIINFQADPSTLPLKKRRFKDFAADNISEGKELEKWGEKYPTVSGGGPWKCAACGKICVYTYYILRPGGLLGVSMGVLDRCVWCLRCYAAGRYPAILNENQFLKVDLPVMGGEGEGTGEWSAYETERLIDAIELYKENWEAVAQYVGTDKTAKQCVAFFIQMPIQEPFLTEDDSKPEPPFGNSTNPLLSQLTFLASMVDPAVAKAAAKAALQTAIDRGIPSQHTPPPPPTELSEKTWEELPGGYVSEADLQAISASALAASVVRARELADAEQREMQKLLPEILDLQMKKIQVKIEQFNGIEQIVKNEKNILKSNLAHIARQHETLASDKPSDTDK